MFSERGGGGDEWSEGRRRRQLGGRRHEGPQKRSKSAAISTPLKRGAAPDTQPYDMGFKGALMSLISPPLFCAAPRMTLSNRTTRMLRRGLWERTVGVFLWSVCGCECVCVGVFQMTFPLPFSPLVPLSLVPSPPFYKHRVIVPNRHIYIPYQSRHS